MGWFSRMFGTQRKKRLNTQPHIFFTNTLTGNKELFIPIKPGLVTMYSCGPTVYRKQHIGNVRGAFLSDLIARVLTSAGYNVNRVLNITDVGHLTSDGDEGEDKIAISAKKEKKTPKEISEQYAKLYIDDLAEIGIDVDAIRFPRATDYIREQIALATTLEEKGFAYRVTNGLAFDTSRFAGYGKLGNIILSEERVGARIEADKEKRHPADFWLWRTAKPGDLQQWDSPWGRGNPGWHIECSAMSRALLGQEIDIHTGGEDLVSIHHNNEIAQSEAASGRPFVHYWMHNAFLNLEGEKISKSLGNVVYVSDIIAKGYHPLALRYFYLQAHYRTPLSFSWDALASAGNGLTRLWTIARRIGEESDRTAEYSEASERFRAVVRDDLATPHALAVLWESLRSEDYTPEEKWGLIEDADANLGLMLIDPPDTGELKVIKTPELTEMLARRDAARAKGDFTTADRIRQEFENSGYRVEDGPEGTVLTERGL